MASAFTGIAASAAPVYADAAVDLIIEDLDEFATGFTALTTADYVFSAAPSPAHN